MSDERLGFFASLNESLRSHFDERFKSPFSGAFLVSWLGVNWKALFILLFSEQKAAERLAYLAEGGYLSFANLVGHPIWIAFIVAVVFYLLSALFLSVREIYGLGSRWIERRFERQTWRSPAEYIRLKLQFEKRNAELMDLASDNLSELEGLRTQLNAAAEASLEQKIAVAAIQEEKAKLLQDVARKQEEIGELRLRHQRVTELAQTLNRANLAVPDRAKSLVSAFRSSGLLSKLESDAGSLLQAVELIVALDSLESELRDSESGGPGASENLMTRVSNLSRRCFPALPVDVQLQARMLIDMEKAGLSAAGLLDDVIELALRRAAPAVEALSKEYPEAFSSGTDFMTKSLGFLYPEFRASHGFSRRTRAGFEKFAGLVHASEA